MRSTGIAQYEPGMLRLFAGFCIWAVGFVALYVGHALSCLYAAPASPAATAVKLALIAIWLLHVYLLGAMAWRSARRLYPGQDGVAVDRPSYAWFTLRLVLLLDVFACAAMFATGIPIALVAVCQG